MPDYTVHDASYIGSCGSERTKRVRVRRTVIQEIEFDCPIGKDPTEIVDDIYGDRDWNNIEYLDYRRV